MVVEPLIVVPNAFSPNDDGHNDYIYVITLGDVTLNHFRIYSRWGNLVFETNGTGTNYGWDGRFKGEAQPVGVYTYVVSIPDGLHHKAAVQAGNISLLR